MKTKAVLRTIVFGMCLTAATSLSQAQSAQSPPPKPTPQPNSSPVVVVPATPTPLNWKTYEFRYGDGEVLSLLLPREPKIDVEKNSVEKGIDVVTHIITSEADETVYVAGYIEMMARDSNLKITPEIRKELSRQFWNFLADGIREGLAEIGFEAKLTAYEPKSVMVHGREGQEQEFLIGKMPGRYRAVIGERHVYMLMTVSMSDKDLREREAVMQSFKISHAK